MFATDDAPARQLEYIYLYSSQNAQWFAGYPRCRLALLGFALRDSAAVRPRHTRGAHEGAARSRVGPREYVAPAAPSDPERR